MRIGYSCLIIAVITLIACNRGNTDGVYVGFEEMSSVTPYDSLRKWYHKNNLSVEGDSVFLYQQPISIYKNDTAFSASDGGFYYYKGTIVLKADSIEIDLLRTGCDYCAEPVKINKDGSMTKLKVTKKLSGTVDKTGFKLNGLAYKKVQNSKENAVPRQ